MKPEVTTDNRVFKYAFAGVLFFIATVGFTLTHYPGIVSFSLADVVVAGFLGIASLFLLYTAIKNDKDRLREA
jgi:hypothetical protein